MEDHYKEDSTNERMTSAEYTSVFLERYFYDTDREAYMIDFTDLKLEEMIVTTYAAKFIQLSHYASHLVPTEVERAQKFQLGLCLPIVNRMMTPCYPNMEQCMD